MLLPKDVEGLKLIEVRDQLYCYSLSIQYIGLIYCPSFPGFTTVKVNYISI